MINRRLEKVIVKHLRQFPAVGIVGPRQCGKTTLAKKIRKLEGKKDGLYYDLESPADRSKFYDPELLLLSSKGNVIIDEVQRMPELFPILRSVIDKNRKKGKYLLLGSASFEFSKSNSESLAGRIFYVEAHPFNLTELPTNTSTIQKHWLRGGFPDAWRAKSSNDAFNWHDGFMRTFIERDLNTLFEASISTPLMFRMWRMLAHYQAQILNTQALAKSLDVSHGTISKYLDFLEASFMLRRLSPYFVNSKKRLVKTPKIYIRDSGVFHYLADIRSSQALQNHPMVGYSWEAYVIEQIIQLLPNNIKPFFYRTQDGAEIDLILVKGMKVVAGIEIKNSAATNISRGLSASIADLSPQKTFIITRGNDPIYPIKKNIWACNLSHFLSIELPKITKN